MGLGEKRHSRKLEEQESRMRIMENSNTLDAHYEALCTIDTHKSPSWLAKLESIAIHTEDLDILGM